MKSANIFSFDDFYEERFQVIAIRTTLEDYKLAYVLNKSLESSFERLSPDLDYVIEGKNTFFSSYKYKNPLTSVYWFLVKNKVKTIQKNFSENHVGGLFETQEAFSSTYVYLQPEIKQADFLLKIEDELLEDEIKDMLVEINRIEGIVTAYEVDTSNLKYKEYLIF